MSFFPPNDIPNYKKFKKLVDHHVNLQAKGLQAKYDFYYSSHFRNFIHKVIQKSEMKLEKRAQLSFVQYFENISEINSSLHLETDRGCVFLLSPRLEEINQVISFYSTSHFNPPVELWFIPYITQPIKEHLKEFNLLSNKGDEPNATNMAYFTVRNLNITTVVCDTDLLLCPRPNVVLRTALHDLEIVSDIRHALEQFSYFKSIYAFGTLSSSIARTLTTSSKIESPRLIILDRSADLITPLMTQCGYEGLISECFGLEFSIADVQSPEGKIIHEDFSSIDDTMFLSLRSMTLSEVIKFIDQTHTEIKSVMEQKYSVDDQNAVSNFRNEADQFVKTKTIFNHNSVSQQLTSAINSNQYFSRLLSLENTALTNRTIPFSAIQELIEEGAPFEYVMRMVCLSAILSGSFSDYSALVKALYINYGIGVIGILERLIEMGYNFSKNSFGVLKYAALIKPLALQNPKWEENGEVEAGVYMGYTPITTRICQKVVNGEFSTVKKLMEPYVHEVFCSLNQNELEKEKERQKEKNEQWIVLFVGGCTHSEINALRRISQLGIDKPQFSFITTELFSSKSFIKDLSEGIPIADPIA